MTEPTAVDWRRVVSTALGVLAGAVATAGTLAVAVAGFTLSYDAIRKVGIAAGVRPDWAWLLPVSIDGAMAVGTVTAVVLRRMGRKPWYPWLVVLAGAGISIACNALHARMRDLIQLDDYTAMAVSAIPAVMLALSVHLLVVLIDAAARAVGQPATSKAAEVDTTTAPLSTVEPASVADTVPVIPVDTTPATPPPPKRTERRTARRTEPRTTGRPSARTKVAAAVAKTPDATPAEIAAKLRISEKTVKRHLPDRTPDTTQDNSADKIPGTKPVNGHPVSDLIDAS